MSKLGVSSSGGQMQKCGSFFMDPTARATPPLVHPFSHAQLPAQDMAWKLQTTVSLAQAVTPSWLLLLCQRLSGMKQDCGTEAHGGLIGWPQLSDCSGLLAQRDPEPASPPCGLCPWREHTAWASGDARGREASSAGTRHGRQPCLPRGKPAHHCIRG